MINLPCKAFLDTLSSDVGVECIPGAPTEPIENRRQLCIKLHDNLVHHL